MRYELTDDEWAAVKPMLPNKPRGVPRVNDRRVLNGIFWVLRSGAPCSGVASRHDRGRLDHQDDALLRRARAMHNAPRNDEALIGQKLNRSTFEVDDELSTQHEEELIVVVVFVPMVLALHHAKAHHRVV